MQTRSKAVEQPLSRGAEAELDDEGIVHELLSDDETDNVFEKTQPIPEQPASEQKKPEFSQLKDQWIENLRSKEDRSDYGNHVCGRCRNSLDDRYYNLVGCQGPCDRWFHADCVGLSEVDYQQLLDDEQSRWVCLDCKTLSPLQVAEPNIPHIGNSYSSTSQQMTQPDNANIVLPSPADTSSTIDEAVWGVLKGTDITSAVNHAYSVVVRWKKNLFRVPSGKAGKEFTKPAYPSVLRATVTKSSAEGASALGK